MMAPDSPRGRRRGRTRARRLAADFGLRGLSAAVGEITARSVGCRRLPANVKGRVPRPTGNPLALKPVTPEPITAETARLDQVRVKDSDNSNKRASAKT